MGTGFFILLAIAIGLYLLVGPGLGMVAFFRGSGGTETQLAGLHKRIDDLSAELAALRRLLAGLNERQIEAMLASGATLAAD